MFFFYFHSRLSTKFLIYSFSQRFDKKSFVFKQDFNPHVFICCILGYNLHQHSIIVSANFNHFLMHAACHIRTVISYFSINFLNNFLLNSFTPSFTLSYIHIFIFHTHIFNTFILFNSSVCKYRS